MNLTLFCHVILSADVMQMYKILERKKAPPVVHQNQLLFDASLPNAVYNGQYMRVTRHN